ncbi:hypothetical protein D3C87_1203310 [compost metagenome]
MITFIKVFAHLFIMAPIDLIILILSFVRNTVSDSKLQMYYVGQSSSRAQVALFEIEACKDLPLHALELISFDVMRYVSSQKNNQAVTDGKMTARELVLLTIANHSRKLLYADTPKPSHIVIPLIELKDLMYELHIAAIELMLDEDMIDLKDHKMMADDAKNQNDVAHIFQRNANVFKK